MKIYVVVVNHKYGISTFYGISDQERTHLLAGYCQENWSDQFGVLSDDLTDEEIIDRYFEPENMGELEYADYCEAILNPIEAYETAACLWEAALQFSGKPKLVSPAILAFKEHWELVGTAQMRSEIVAYTSECDAAYEAVKDTFEDSFDWDFVPGFLLQKIEERWRDA